MPKTLVAVVCAALTSLAPAMSPVAAMAQTRAAVSTGAGPMPVSCASAMPAVARTPPSPPATTDFKCFI